MWPLCSFYLNAKERKRASEAYNLCAVLQHPGNLTVISALDNIYFGATILTDQDNGNGRRLRGLCLA